MYNSVVILRVDSNTLDFIDKKCKDYGGNRSTYIRMLLEQEKGKVNIASLPTRDALLTRKEILRSVNDIKQLLNDRIISADEWTSEEKERVTNALIGVEDKLKNI